MKKRLLKAGALAVLGWTVVLAAVWAEWPTEPMELWYPRGKLYRLPAAIDAAEEGDAIVFLPGDWSAFNAVCYISKGLVLDEREKSSPDSRLLLEGYRIDYTWVDKPGNKTLLPKQK